jgi:DNA repair exonuclease SbcCD ATPase subunit
VSVDYESDMASLCDFINTLCREVGVLESNDYTSLLMKAAVDRIVFKQREQLDAAQAEVQRLKGRLSQAESVIQLGIPTEERLMELESVNDACALREQELESEVQRLKQWVADCQSGMYINCVYCGHRYGTREDTPVAMADVLKEHIEQCPQHPLSAMKKAHEELYQRLKRVRYAVLCARDSYTKDTDSWKFFNDYLDEIDGEAL